MQEDIEKIERKINEVEQKSFATLILEDYKRQNKRLFVIVIMLLVILLFTGGYLVYVLNDIGVEETTITQENEDGYNNYIGNDGDIDNG